MESVGEFLRLEREAQGKSIEDVAKVTKMSPLTISALEDDRFSALPAPVYVKGHLRTYARFLGLKENEVIEKYLRFTQQQEHEELDEWDTVELELHEEKQRAGRRWIWIAASVAAAVTVIVVWTLELTVKARERTWIQVTVDGATLPVADFHLGAGEERTYEANKYFQLQVGNGGALELYLNGEYLGTAGAGRGLVENLIVNVEGMSR
jgi:cytoskeletal protein RodZ